MRQRRRRTCVLHLDPMHAIDDSRRVLETLQQRIPRLVHIQIRVLHRTFHAPSVGRAKEIRQAEIRARHAPLVEQRRLMGRHKSTTGHHEPTDLLALRRRQRRDIRQDQRAELRDVVQQSVMNHLKRNACLDHCLVKPQRVLLHLRTVELRGLLRVHHPDPRQRPFIAQVLFSLVMPRVDFLNRLQPTLVDRFRIELGEPRAQPLRDSIDHPQLDFIGTLDGILPAFGLFQTHADDATDRLRAHRGAVFLGVFTNCPRRHQPTARLSIGE